MNTTIITSQVLTCSENEELVVRKKKKPTKFPNYYKVGTGTMNKDKIQSINLITEVMNLSKPAQSLISRIMDGMSYDTNTKKVRFLITFVPITSSEKNMVSRGYKELYTRNLVKRIKRSNYMINPNALITDYEEQLEVWQQHPDFTSQS